MKIIVSLAEVENSETNLACLERALFGDVDKIGEHTEEQIAAALNTRLSNIVRSMIDRGEEELSRSIGVKKKVFTSDNAVTLADAITAAKASVKP